MEEIKSIRVRRKNPNSSERFGDLDIKVTLFKNGRKRVTKSTSSNGHPIWNETEYGGKDDTGNRYRNYSDDEIIKDFISINSKLSGNEYDIIQDPWLDEPPKLRSFGFDPYYLSNGSYVVIKWIAPGNISEGGTKWSDNNGDELSEVPGINKGDITKYVDFIKPPEGSTDSLLILTNYGLEPSSSDNDKLKFSGRTKDTDILDQVIAQWNISVSNYNLDICDPNYQSCNIIDYKSPFGEPEPEPNPDTPTEESEQGNEDKIKLSVVLPEDLELKVKEDLESLKIYIGEPPASPSDFIFQDDFENLDELDPEFAESAFAGVEQGGEEYISTEEGEELRAEAALADIAQDTPPNNTPGASTGLESTGTYTSELPKESNKNPKNYKVTYGFNGVPYYGQYDSRWGDVIYGLSNQGTFVEAKVTPPKGATWRSKTGVGKYSVDFKGKSYTILCDWFNGNDGFSSIFGGGCGITSMSMIINFWMIKLKKGIYTSPIKMAKMACENGARSKKPPCNGTQPGKTLYSQIKNTYGLEMSSTTKSDAESLVKQGYPVMMCGTWEGYRGDGSVKKQTGGHFIVITGYDSTRGVYRVNDPGSTKGTYYFKSLPNKAFWKILPPSLA